MNNVLVELMDEVAVMRMRECPPRGRPVLFALPRGLSAAVAPGASADGRATGAAELPALCAGLFAARQIEERAMRGVWRPKFPDAPRGLWKAANGSVALPEASSGIAKNRLGLGLGLGLGTKFCGNEFTFTARS